MRLISCHIDGFGALRNKDVVFDPHLTCLLEGNGSGKSTLCAFLRAMLFGMESYTVATKKFTDREHYVPFSASPYGGSLTVESGGAEYRIERRFGKKSEKDDECRLYRDGAPMESSENIGQILTGLDKQAAFRLCFYPAREEGSPLTPTVRERLDRILEGGEGEFDAPAALRALEEARKKYRPQRGSGGKIRALEEEEHRLAEELLKLSRLETLQKEETDLLAEKRNAHAALASELRRAAEWNGAVARRREWEGMGARLEETRGAREAIRREFPDGFPEREELARLEGALLALRRGVEVPPLPAEKSRRLAELEGEFPEGVPTEEAILHARKDVAALRRVDGELLALEHPMGEDAALLARFGAVPVSEETKRRIRALDEEGKSLRKAPPSLRKKSLLLFLLCALLPVGAGVGLLAFFPSVGLALLFGGILFGAVSLAFVVARGRADLRRWRAECGRAESRLLEALSTFGLGVGDFTEAVLRFDAEVLRHEALLRAREDRRLALGAEREALLRRITLLASEKHPEESLDRLVSLRGEYLTLAAERAQIEERRRGAEENARRAAEAVREFCRKWKISPENAAAAPARIAARRAEWESLSRRIAVEEEARAQYLAQNAVAEEGAAPIDVAEYEELSSALAHEIGKLSRSVEDRAEQLLAREDTEAALALCKERLAACRRRADQLELAESLLRGADETLRQRYVAPVRDAYLGYAAPLEEALGQGVHLDRDLCLRFEKDGALREEKYLSSGQRTLSDLAFRLALLHAVTGEGGAPLILDDPFSELDAAHLERAKTLLRKLSEKEQIVYLTCHESRAILPQNSKANA